MKVPVDFRPRFEAWWDELIAEGGRRKYPYLADEALMAELDAMSADAPERAWIHEILIDWLDGVDTLRWQPALALLLRERVPGAADAMRTAAANPNTDDKRALAGTFLKIADELDDALGSPG